MVKLIKNHCNCGFAAANNQVLSKVDSNYFVLLNNDCRLEKNILEQLEKDFIQYMNVAVISPQLVDEEGNKQRSYGYFMQPLDEVLPRKVKNDASANSMKSGIMDVDTVIGACMAVRGTAIDAIDLLDEDFFFYFEETEWCYRFKKAGYRVVLDSGIKIVHEKGKSTRAYRKGAQIEMLRSRLTYYKKVFPKHVAIILTGYRFMRLLFNSFFSVVFVCATFGCFKKARKKSAIYLTQLFWWILGKPWSWGLPDKCPRNMKV